MNRMFTKLMGVGVALALCLMGTTAWVNAQANDQAVTDSMLLGDPAASWLHTNGNLAGHRYSVLTQLNTSNADQLGVAWIFAPGGETDAQNTPLYHDGIVYFAQDNKVFAIDARSGRRLWKYEHELPRRSVATTSISLRQAPRCGHLRRLHLLPVQRLQAARHSLQDGRAKVRQAILALP